MLIEFSVENFRSIKELATLSMVANNHIKKNMGNTIKSNYCNLLKTAAIYGANASGKSNILKAMIFAAGFVINSSKDSQVNEPTGVEPFLLSTETVDLPSTFQFVFLHENIKYRYGFSLNGTKIVEEWLYRTDGNKEEMLFERNNQDIQIDENKFQEGLSISDKTRENALFLSVVANFNGQISGKVIRWFLAKLVVLVSELPNGVTSRILKQQKFKDEFIKIFKKLDLFIEDIKFEKINVDELPEHIQKYVKKQSQNGENFELPPLIKTFHKQFDSQKKYVQMIEFDFEDQESIGTRRLYSVLGPILEALYNGSVLAIDELEIKLHPLIVKFLIELFNSKKYNKFGAQMIFTTHDVNILDNELLRKDQIWFTQKDLYGATTLYSLNDYSGVRNCDARFNKSYLAGLYGGIPLLINNDFFVENCKG